MKEKRFPRPMNLSSESSCANLARENGQRGKKKGKEGTKNGGERIRKREWKENWSAPGSERVDTDGWRVIKKGGRQSCRGWRVIKKGGCQSCRDWESMNETAIAKERRFDLCFV